MSVSDGNLEWVLSSGAFAVTAELGPPKSADAEAVARKAGLLAGFVDAANITDNQSAVVRMSSIAAAVIALREGVEPVVQVTCRDRNRISIQSDVLGAAALGLKNVLCLTGDHQSFGNHPAAKNVYDVDSVQLIAMIKEMRDGGRFSSGDEIRTSKKAPIAPPRLLIGAAENPFADPLEFRALRLAKKARAGADFIQTQCIFDMERFEEFMRQVRNRGIHERVKIIAGLTPLKSLGMARHMKENIAGLSIPDSCIRRLEKAEDKAAEGVKMCIEQILRLREVEGVAGVHVMAIEWEERVPEIVKGAGLLPRPVRREKGAEWERSR